MADAANGKGSRVPHVCQGCRARHTRCAWDAGQGACRPCRAIGLDCIPQPIFRFRHDAKAKRLSAGPSNAQYVWASAAPSSLMFHDETADLQKKYAIETPPDDTTGATPSSQFDFHSSPETVIQSVHSGISDDLRAFYGNSTSPEALNDPSSSTQNVTTSFTPSEALLVRHYSSKMALWNDATDPTRIFEHEVPRRALTDPLLRHAICAFAARHFHRNEQTPERQAEALEHQTKCLEHLIPAMSEGQRINESILTAVAILRQSEEMDETDNRFHLEGISRIMGVVPHFVAAGGLGESAAWLCLREDIYVSLTTQSRINIPLDSFSCSASILRADDYSWANRIILILGQFLNRTFDHPTTEEDIATSQTDIDNWDRLKPITYRPIYLENNTRSAVRSFPKIWMLAPHNAVGLQYFHIAQIILAMMKQDRDRAGRRPYSDLIAHRAKERHITHHLRFIVGLAISNPTAENTFFTAHHCLSVWAGCLRKPGDQQAALSFLKDMSQRTSWNTAPLIESLRLQWEDDSESG